MSTTCLQELSGFKFLSSNQLLKYKESWRFFDKIQNYNSNISTLRFQGDSTLTYYQFASSVELLRFRRGQYLHQQSYPTGNWEAVEQN